MRAYALVELGDSEAIDLFLREEDAQAALASLADRNLEDRPATLGDAAAVPARAGARALPP